MYHEEEDREEDNNLDQRCFPVEVDGADRAEIVRAETTWDGYWENPKWAMKKSVWLGYKGGIILPSSTGIIIKHHRIPINQPVQRKVTGFFVRGSNVFSKLWVTDTIAES